MYRKTIYIIALLLPLLLRYLILNTQFSEWLTEKHYVEAASNLIALRKNAAFQELVAGWALPVFIIVTLIYWLTEDSDSNIPGQFLWLPVCYVPFTIIGVTLVTGQFHQKILITHPMLILPVGYAYVLAWSLLIWMLGLVRLVR